MLSTDHMLSTCSMAKIQLGLQRSCYRESDWTDHEC
jgi:hypothetical protein